MRKRKSAQPQLRLFEGLAHSGETVIDQRPSQVDLDPRDDYDRLDDQGCFNGTEIRLLLGGAGLQAAPDHLPTGETAATSRLAA